MSVGAYETTARTRPTRAAQRVSYDRAAVHAVLDEAVLCHLGFVVDGEPVVLPQLHARVGDELFLHGSTGARALRAARGDGLAVCVTVTLLDALVLARSAFHHSVNYRSVVVHGLAREVTDPAAKRAALAALVDGIVAGRSGGVRGPSGKELAATTVLSLRLEQVSLKVRTGPPKDDEEDLGLPHWAGELPLSTVAGGPVPAPDLAPPRPVPAHVATWVADRSGPTRAGGFTRSGDVP